ncbi:unnamed protein product [marine sediment metagenome]|uniref:Uncharacterized protein n=1 Tax=marine sediment metagenome TaxID=412755 RepID=X0S2Q5_9ZZZZ
MVKKIIIGIFLILLIATVTAPITDVKIPYNVRLGENLTIAGDYGTANTLCKFIIKDTNGVAIERLSDEYTFSDGTFYAQRQINEPPYYRGDDYNVVITCGSDEAFQMFKVNQPISLAHPIQRNWEYLFAENNTDAIMLGGTFIALAILGVLAFAFIIKKGKDYAG